MKKPHHSNTLSQFLINNAPDGSKGDFNVLMMAVQTAVKVTEHAIRRGSIMGNFGLAKSSNTSGDDQQKLDIIADEAFKQNLVSCERVFAMGSEENEFAILVDEPQRGRYVICFDPLDGSSNIDANVSVGSIWGIWRVDENVQVKDSNDLHNLLLMPGNKMVSAGYSNYGSATNLVLTTGNGVYGFTMDPSIGEFVMTHSNIQIPQARTIYSVNEGNQRYWEPWFLDFVNHIKYKTKKPYSSRYIGSMVADVHRTLLYGGIFCYPNDAKSKEGKLRYLYEAAPMAMIMEQAGGKATTGTQRILDVVPGKLHQRVPVFMGSANEVDLCMSFRKQNPPRPQSKL